MVEPLSIRDLMDLVERMGRGGTLAEDAWHGSPRAFAQFSTDHTGRGEGNQSWGWGLYFADKREVADWYRRQLAADRGHLYRVRLPSEAAFMDWDIAFARQSAPVQAAVLGMPEFRRLRSDADDWYLEEHLTGAHVYHELQNARGSAKAASLALSDAGIVGIRYKDGGSRGAEAGSFNYVVFDARMIAVLNREDHGPRQHPADTGEPG